MELSEKLKWFLENILKEGYSILIVNKKNYSLETKDGYKKLKLPAFLISELYAATKEKIEDGKYSVQNLLDEKLINLERKFEFGEILELNDGNKAVFIGYDKQYSIIVIKDKFRFTILETSMLHKALK